MCLNICTMTHVHVPYKTCALKYAFLGHIPYKQRALKYAFIGYTPYLNTLPLNIYFWAMNLVNTVS